MLIKIPMTYSPGSDGPYVYRCCDLVIFHEPQAIYHLWRDHDLPFLQADAAVEALRCARNGLAQEAMHASVSAKDTETAQQHCPTALEAFLVQCQYAHRPCPEQDARRLLDILGIPCAAPAADWSASIDEAVQRWVDGAVQGGSYVLP